MQKVITKFRVLFTNKLAIERARLFSQKAFSSKYLLYTNVLISVTLSSVGDTMQQKYEMITGELDTFDSQRTAHMALSGSTVGVVCHYWYRFIDRRLPGRTINIVMKKVFWDQLVCSPVVIATFFLTLGLLERSNKDEIVNEIKSKAWKLYAAEWVIWPPAQIINFLWLPNRYRVLYDNTISLGYDVYTSKVKHSK